MRLIMRQTWLRYFLTIYLIVLMNLCGIEAKPMASGLYDITDEQDAVFELTQLTYDQRVFHSSNSWLMQFYNSWCGHCISFAPLYKSLAADIKGWRSIVTLASVNCAAEENMALCKSFNVKMFPTLMLISAQTMDRVSGVSVRQHSKVEEFRVSIVDILSNQTLSQLPPTSQPLLKPIRRLEDMFVSQTGSESGSERILPQFVLILDREQSFLGRQIVLDFCEERRLVVRWSTLEQLREIGQQETPAMFLVDGSTRKLTKLLGSSTSREDYVKVLASLLNDSSQPVLPSDVKTLDKTSVVGVPKASSSTKVYNDKNGEVAVNEAYDTLARSYLSLHSQDLESSLFRSLIHEVAMQQTIGPEALQALRLYVNVLALYLPVQDSLVTLLFSISDWLNSLPLTSQITGDEWLQHINTFQASDSLPLSTNQWTGCRGTEERYRGYPCSLWMTFHALTVAAYTNELESIDSHQVLVSVRGYVDHFFSCRDCRNHFLDSTTDLLTSTNSTTATHRPSSADSVLYLWRLHNSVNKRLAGSASADPFHPKLQFPTVRQCLMCHQSVKVKDTWDEGQVLRFLVNMYSEGSVIQDSRRLQNELRNDAPESGKRLLYPGDPKNSGENNSAQKQAGWDSSDQNGGGLFRRKRMLEKVRTAGSEAALYHDHGRNLDKVRGDRPSGLLYTFGLDKIDLGMCVMFYFFCTVMLVLGYLHLARRKRSTLLAAKLPY